MRAGLTVLETALAQLAQAIHHCEVCARRLKDPAKDRKLRLRFAGLVS
jgi:hypothetical protein